MHHNRGAAWRFSTLDPPMPCTYSRTGATDGPHSALDHSCRRNEFDRAEVSATFHRSAPTRSDASHPRGMFDHGSICRIARVCGLLHLAAVGRPGSTQRRRIWNSSTIAVGRPEPSLHVPDRAGLPVSHLRHDHGVRTRGTRSTVVLVPCPARRIPACRRNGVDRTSLVGHDRHRKSLEGELVSSFTRRALPHRGGIANLRLDVQDHGGFADRYASRSLRNTALNTQRH